MKITVDAESLVSGVQFVTKSFNSKDDKAFIALVLKDGEGYLSHENATSLMKAPVSISRVSFTAEEPEEVRLALEGVFLQKLASVLSGVKGEVELSKKLDDEVSPLKVLAPTGRFTIPVFDSKIPDLKEFDSLGYVSDFEYFDALSRLSKICDAKHASTVPLLSSITLSFDVDDEKTITMMATDRYALGEIIVPFTPVDEKKWLSENSSIFVPVEFANLISASKDGSTINLVREPVSRKYGYAFDDGRVALFSLKDVSQAFAYGDQKEKAIKSISTSFRASMTGLKKALNAVSTLSWDEPNVYLNVTGDGKVFVTDTHEQNVVSVPIEGFYSENKEDLRVAFIREVINEALAPISSSETFLGINSSNAPVSFRNVNEEEEEPDSNVFSLAAPAVNRK